MSAPFVALFFDTPVVKGSYADGCDELVHQTVGILSFIAAEQTGKIEHDAGVDIEPFVVRFPERYSGTIDHPVTISERSPFLAVAAGVSDSELEFGTDARSKPFTGSYREIRRDETGILVDFRIIS